MATRQPNNLQQEIRWLLEEKYGGNITAKAQKDIQRLEKGEHIDYVIGFVEFLGCKTDLSQKPLIPRPETEYWVERTIQYVKRKSSARASLIRCLDIFAGSGCIGVAVLKHIPFANVDFAEKEKKLLKQIKINAKLNRISSKRYRVFQSDIFSNVKGRYDYILANPPYVAETRKTKVQKSVLEQEPKAAVFGGKDGLYYIRKFLKKIGGYLVPGGVVYLEFDSHQRRDIIKLAKVAGVKEVDVRKDQFGKWRYARIVF